MEETDGALVQRIAEGGPEGRAAESALFRRFAPRVRLYGLRHLRDEDRARDLVQAVLLGVIEAARARRISELDKVDRFVLGTCRNVALRMRELDARAKPTPIEEFSDILDEEIERVDTASLLRCFDGLEGRARRVVQLTFLEDRPAGEIANALETTAGNVRVLRHRALSALRKCLDGKEAHP